MLGLAANCCQTTAEMVQARSRSARHPASLHREGDRLCYIAGWGIASTPSIVDATAEGGPRAGVLLQAEDIGLAGSAESAVRAAGLSPQEDLEQAGLARGDQ